MVREPFLDPSRYSWVVAAQQQQLQLWPSAHIVACPVIRPSVASIASSTTSTVVVVVLVPEKKVYCHFHMFCMQIALHT